MFRRHIDLSQIFFVTQSITRLVSECYLEMKHFLQTD